MRGNPEVLAALQAALRSELTAVNQYVLHGEMCDNWGYERLAGVYRERARTEMKHAEALVERLLFLEGMPLMMPLELNVGGTPEAQLASDLRIEQQAILDYEGASKLARAVGDNVSANLFEAHLAAEQDHVNYVEAAQHEVAELGYPLWLAQQATA